jgi:transposase
MVELMEEHHAGIPILMNPRSGNSRDAHDCCAVVGTHVHQRHTTYGTTYLVADRAIDRAANRQQLAQTRMRWMTRVPATLSEAHAALAQVNPHPLASLTEGYRSHEWLSTDGGMAQRWVLIDSAARQPHAQHPVAKPWRQQRDKAVKAFKK